MSGLPEPKSERLRERLRALGFDEVKFAVIDGAEAETATGPRALPAWLAAGMHADMHWMERSVEKRLRPDLVLSGARSMIMLGVSYSGDAPQLPRNEGPPRWARYAQYEDYHDTMKPGLVAAGRVLEELYGVGPTDYRYYVDTGPVIDRGWAARSGIGFIGKNAMLISRRFGNWLLLGAILTRIDLPADAPIRKTTPLSPAGGFPAASSIPPAGLLCGKCTRCLDACPTNAFAAPGIVDARRCISYQTIENKGVIPRALRAGIGNRVYGCDVCLEVCPWNRFAREGRNLLLAARGDLRELTLAELLALTPERFAALFRRTPIKRLKLTGLLRNACVVAGNSGDRSLLPALVRLATTHESALVRAHAVWAAARLGGDGMPADAENLETDPIVKAEYVAERTPGVT